MKPLNVKSTILHKLLDAVAPYYCCSCGEIGSLLCESCKYDIINDQSSGCALCGHPSLSRSCPDCRSDIDRSWCGGERSGGLEALINEFKFHYAKAAYAPLSDILLAVLPQLPPETVVVPIPTVRAHIRARGYDHTLLLARSIAQQRQLVVTQPLRRRTSAVQRGANRRARHDQAAEAFVVTGALDSSIPYLLIDDVVTTGATVKSAAKAMKQAGATTVWAGIAARQPLDEQG